MGAFKFTELTPREAGFREVFDQRIVPILERHEQARLEHRRSALTGMGVAGTGTVGALGAGAFFESMLGFIFGLFGGFATWAVKSYYEKKWQKGLGQEVLPILCDFMGEMEYGKQKIDVHSFVNLGVVPHFHEVSMEDPVTGRHDGLNWYMTEAHLQTKSRDSKGKTKRSTVFRGLLFMISIHGPAPKIFFGKDRSGRFGWLSEMFSSQGSGMEKLDLGNPEFNEVYQVYTSDPVAARNFIDDRLTAGLREVAEIESGKQYIACGMEGDWMYLALPRSDDFLGLGSLFKPLTDIESDLHEAIADLDLPTRVLDRLRGV